MKTQKELTKENKELRKYLRQIKNLPRHGDFDCGLDIQDDDCPCEDCGKCLATFALKKDRPKFRNYRRI